MTAETKTIKEAALAIGVHWKTVDRWTREGIVAFIQHRTKSPKYIPVIEISRLKEAKKSLSAK
jgi:predicted site-specific integrase-resolvase